MIAPITAQVTWGRDGLDDAGRTASGADTAAPAIGAAGGATVASLRSSDARLELSGSTGSVAVAAGTRALAAWLGGASPVGTAGGLPNVVLTTLV